MLANRVRELTSTTGTGDIALAGALPGHIGFSDAFTSGDSVIYVIEDGDNYEIGAGTLIDAVTLERTEVAETLVDGIYLKAGATPIDLSGNARIYCAATADFLLSPTHDADIIREVTPDAGVTADGVLLKDGAVIASKLTSGSAGPGEASPDANDIVLGGPLENNAGLSVLANPTNGRGILYFTDGTSYQNQGGLIYSHQFDRLAVVAGQAEVLHAYGTDIQAKTQLSVQWSVASATISKTTGNHSGPKLVIHNEDDTDSNLSSLQFTSSGSGETFKSATAGIYAQHVGRNATYPYGDLLFYTTDSGGNHNQVLKLGFDQSAAFLGDLSVDGQLRLSPTLSGFPLLASGEAALYSSDTLGTVIGGSGSSTDVYIANRSGSGVMKVLANSVDVEFNGAVSTSSHLSVLGQTTMGSSASIAGSLTVHGNVNQYVGLLQDQDINLTLGSVAGGDARIYLYGTANGQESAGNIDIRTSGNAGVVTIGGELSVQGNVSTGGIVNDLGTHNDVAFSQRGRMALGQIDRGAIMTVANRGLVDQPGLIVEGASGQTGNLLEVRSINAGVANLFAIDPAGNVATGASLSVGTSMNVNGGSTFASAIFAQSTVHVGYRSDGLQSILNIGRQTNNNGGQSTLQFFAHNGLVGNGYKIRFAKNEMTDELQFIDGSDVIALALRNVDKVATFAGDVIGAQFYNRTNDSTSLFSGGSSYNLGANVLMRGEGHASEANDMQFRVAGTPWATYDHSAQTFELIPRVIAQSSVELALGGRLRLASEAVGNHWDLLSGSIWGGSNDDLALIDETGAPYLSFRRSPKTAQFAPDVTVEFGAAAFSGDVSIASDNLDLGDNSNTGAVQKFHADRSGVNQNIMSLEGWWNGKRVASVTAQSGTDVVGKGSGELIFTTAPDDATGIVTRLRIEENGRFHFHGNELTGLASMHSNVDTSNVNIAGGSSVNSGANLYLYGPGHASQASDILFKVDATNTLLYDNSNSEWNFEGNKIVRVGPGNDVSMRIGADSTGAGVTDAAIKVGRVGVPHYLNAEEPVGVWSVVSDGTENQLRMGGATSLMNAPTEISFWTASDATTVTGSQQWKISSDGSLVSLGGTVIRRASDTGSLSISGGTSTGIGANLVLYGASHASEAGNIYLRKDTTPLLKYNDSAQTWDFMNLAVTGVDHIVRGAAADNIGLSGGTTPSMGGNIILYGESHATNPGDILFRDGTSDILIWDSSSSGWNFLQTEIINTPTIRRAIAGSQLNISGGSTNTQGGNIALFGEAHATQAGDIMFRDGAAYVLNYDASAGLWNFQGNKLQSVGEIRMDGDRIYRLTDSSQLNISGGSGANVGANVVLYGESHVTNAGDVEIRSGITPWLSYSDSAGGLSLAAQLLMSNGSVGSPAISFASDADTGIYRLDVNALGFVSGGLGIARIDGGGLQIDSGGNIRAGSGNAGNPGLTFTGDTDTGLFRTSADQLAFTTGGVEAWKINAAQELVNVSGGVIRDQNDNGAITVSGGNAGTSGANLVLYGGTHAINANDIVFRSGAAEVLKWDDSAANWDWLNNDFSQVGNITGDNFWAVNASGLKTLSGGSGITLGANIQLYGESHATQAWDIVFRQNSNVVGAYDNATQAWNFQDKAVATTGIIKGKADTTANRPSASTAGAGATMFDTTLGKPIWSDGSQWVDAAGAAA